MKFFSRRRAPTVRREENLGLERVLPGQGGVILVKRSSARRTLALRVSDAGQVIVNAPMALSGARIEAFLRQHATWLATHLARQLERPGGFAWRDGARLPWLGGTLILVIASAGGPSAIRLEDGVLHCAAAGEAIQAQVVQWYRRQARQRLAERLAFHADRIGLPVPAFRLSDARTRWGSLSPKGVVSLNWRLVKASPEQMDYVICHELAHFRQRNHSAAFWAEVERLFPDWKSARRGLHLVTKDYFDF